MRFTTSPPFFFSIKSNRCVAAICRAWTMCFGFTLRNYWFTVAKTREVDSISLPLSLSPTYPRTAAQRACHIIPKHWLQTVKTSPVIFPTITSPSWEQEDSCCEKQRLTNLIWCWGWKEKTLPLHILSHLSGTPVCHVDHNPYLMWFQAWLLFPFPYNSIQSFCTTTIIMIKHGINNRKGCSSTNFTHGSVSTGLGECCCIQEKK